MKIAHEELQKIKQSLKELKTDRLSWWRHWRDLADFILPRRYVWLLTDNEFRIADQRNTRILDGTGTQAARTLAAGMMNGVTSPGRPWFRLRVPGAEDVTEGPVRLWLDEVQRRMLLTMAESNFYNALAVMYLDLAVFGSAAMLMYEDDAEVIRCYTSPLGEFYLGQDHRLMVNTFAREFSYKVHQVVERWGVENVSEQLRAHHAARDGRQYTNVRIGHLIRPNTGLVDKRFKYEEVYWEISCNQEGLILDVRGFREIPGIFPRWELTANSSYGNSPGMDALPDIVQLQFETKAKAKGLDRMNDPSMLVDAQLRNKPTALAPRGITYVSNLSSGMVGAKPTHTFIPPVREMQEDIADIRQRIREIFHNDLFRMIAQLDTVRSATEIDARREEKLVLLGPVLERFENEALDPSITRLFNIMTRRNMLPEPPQELSNVKLEIQYVSILSDAQRAVGTAAHERFVQFVGNLAGVRPEVLNIPDWEGLVRDYGERIGVPAKGIRTREESEAMTEQEKQLQATQQAAVTGETLAKGAKLASETQLGGGGNALQQLLGGIP